MLALDLTLSGIEALAVGSPNWGLPPPGQAVSLKWVGIGVPFRFFFLMWTIFKVFTEFVTVLFLFYVLVF